jgi:hypothetical protein
MLSAPWPPKLLLRRDNDGLRFFVLARYLMQAAVGWFVAGGWRESQSADIPSGGFEPLFRLDWLQ